MVETFENTFSELQEELHTLNSVPLGSEKRKKKLGLFMMLCVFFPRPDKTKELPINLKAISIMLSELNDSSQ